MRNLLFFALASLTIISCSGLKNETKNPDPSLKFLSQFEIPYGQTYQNTAVGGLSSIDYDPKNDLYYFLSDDRAILNHARFYTAKIKLGTQSIDQVQLQAVNSLKKPEGGAYTNWEKEPNTSIDPEEMRYNPKNKKLVWCSEGARVVHDATTVLQNPTIQIADLKGNYNSNYPLPANLVMSAEEKGPRSNSALEGLSFNSRYTELYASVEEPLYEDGSQASVTKGGLVRFYVFDAKTKRNTAQYGYILDPVAHAPEPENGFKVNGIATIQYYNENQLLVVERSYSVGRPSCTIKIYLCDFSKATNVKDRVTIQNPDIVLATKKLILNLDDLNLFVDNVEGITFGPKLTNGKSSLLLVTDNNFSNKQKTQIFLFEVN